MINIKTKRAIKSYKIIEKLRYLKCINKALQINISDCSLIFNRNNSLNAKLAERI